MCYNKAMIEKAQNKMQGKEHTKTASVAEPVPFFFPEHGVTVMAVNQEEALKKLEEITSNFNK
jgi:hypothetical protein